MSCLCAPTTHAGSFRCRLHRPQQSWGGRPMPCRPSNTEELDATSVSGGESSVVREKSSKSVSFSPASPPRSSSSSPAREGSRLNRMATSSDEPEVLKTVTNEEQMYTMKMVTGNGGSYASAPGARPAVFRMLKPGNSTTKIFS